MAGKFVPYIEIAILRAMEMDKVYDALKDIKKLIPETENIAVQDFFFTLKQMIDQGKIEIVQGDVKENFIRPNTKIKLKEDPRLSGGPKMASQNKVLFQIRTLPITLKNVDTGKDEITPGGDIYNVIGYGDKFWVTDKFHKPGVPQVIPKEYSEKIGGKTAERAFEVGDKVEYEKQDAPTKFTDTMSSKNPTVKLIKVITPAQEVKVNNLNAKIINKQGNKLLIQYLEGNEAGEREIVGSDYVMRIGGYDYEGDQYLDKAIDHLEEAIGDIKIELGLKNNATLEDQMDSIRFVIIKLEEYKKEKRPV